MLLHYPRHSTRLRTLAWPQLANKLTMVRVWVRAMLVLELGLRSRVRVSDSVYTVWCKNRGDPHSDTVILPSASSISSSTLPLASTSWPAEYSAKGLGNSREGSTSSLDLRLLILCSQKVYSTFYIQQNYNKSKTYKQLNRTNRQILQLVYKQTKGGTPLYLILILCTSK